MMGGIQGKKIVKGQTYRTEASRLQSFKHLARTLIDQKQFLFDLSHIISQNLMTHDGRFDSSKRSNARIRVCNTVKFLNFGTPEIFAVIYLKFQQKDQTLR